MLKQCTCSTGCSKRDTWHQKVFLYLLKQPKASMVCLSLRCKLRLLAFLLTSLQPTFVFQHFLFKGTFTSGTLARIRVHLTTKSSLFDKCEQCIFYSGMVWRCLSRSTLNLHYLTFRYLKVTLNYTSKYKPVFLSTNVNIWL